MYASFRTVSSILVVAEFTIPLMAMMALKKIIDYGVDNILYISCKATSLERDLPVFFEAGYADGSVMKTAEKYGIQEAVITK